MALKSEILRALVTERLTAAAEEIFALFERTIREYEEELTRTRDESHTNRTRDESHTNRTRDERDESHTNQTRTRDESHTNQTRSRDESHTNHRNQRNQQLLLDPGRTALDQGRTVQTVPALQRPGVQLQTQNCGVTEESEDSTQPQRNVTFQNDLLQNPTLVTSNETEEMCHSDGGDYEEEEPCSSSARQHGELEEERDTYNQDFNVSSQLNFSGDGSVDKDSSEGKTREEKVKKHECYFCEKKFKDRHSLRRHSVVHTGQKPFQCPICAKNYSYKETLMSHMALHGWSKKPGEEIHVKPPSVFTCPICSKCMTTSFALRSHVLIHTGEKPFSCPICGKTFSQKVYVRKHLRTHTGERPFSCSQCHMSFSRKSNLNRHLKVHAAQKPQ